MPGTRNRVIASAAELFRAQGVHGTGVLEILDHASAPRGSLYHHFRGGKSELVLAALEFEARRIADQLAALLEVTPDPKAAVVAFADALADTLELSDFRLGCPVTTAALELSSSEGAVRDLCARIYGDWQQMITDHLAAHGHHGAERRAEAVLSAIEGALVLARVRRDGDPVRRVARQMATLLDGASP